MILINEEQTYHEKLQHKDVTKTDLIPDRITSSWATPLQLEFLCQGDEQKTCLAPPIMSHESNKGGERRRNVLVAEVGGL